MCSDSLRHWSGANELSRLRSTQKTLPTGARARNRQLVLRTLFHHGSISRAQLSRITGLTPGTTSTLVRELADEGLVEESAPQRRPSAGKPSTPLRINSDAFHIVGVDLGDPEAITGAVVDLSGRLLHQGSGWIGAAARPDDVAALARSFIEKAERPVLGVGVTTPGLIDASGVALLSTTYPQWRNLPLQQELQRTLGLPVTVANDANSAILAEFTFGGAPGDGLMMITLAQGIGAGLMLGGSLVQGDGSAVGEIGHLTTVEDGLPCECGRRGCLQTIINAPALRAIHERYTGDALNTVITDIGQRTGTALAPLVGALALREIRVSAPADLVTPLLLHTIEHTIRQRVLPISTPPVNVIPATLGSDAQVMGGAALVLSSELGIA